MVELQVGTFDWCWIRLSVALRTGLGIDGRSFRGDAGDEASSILILGEASALAVYGAFVLIVDEAVDLVVGKARVPTSVLWPDESRRRRPKSIND